MMMGRQHWKQGVSWENRAIHQVRGEDTHTRAVAVKVLRSA